MIADTSKNKELKSESFPFITQVPSDIIQIAKVPFYKENRKGLIISIAATGLLLPLDQPISDGVKKMGNFIHLDPETDFAVPIKIGNTKILKVPQNLTSMFYQLGEGGTSMILAGGLFVYGKMRHSKPALITASELTETFITMGITTRKGRGMASLSFLWQLPGKHFQL
jgi:hypothetical protein